MRYVRWVLIAGLLVLPALATNTALGVPACSQVSAEFCLTDENCPSSYVQWQGDCAQGNRQWRCVWPNCPPEGPWIGCNCPGQGGGCDCLLAGTPISMADGTTKPVEAIDVGDAVLGYDQVSGQLITTRVVSVMVPFNTDHYYVINGKLKVTETHPILQGANWTEAGDLKVGDVVTGDGSGLSIYKVQRVDEEALVYNFQVETGTYVAAGFIVHNKDNCWQYYQEPPPPR
jgi:Pretoxin HINT domain